MDASGNQHRPAGATDGGQFLAKHNTAPCTQLVAEPEIRDVPADEVQPGQLMVIGSGTSRRMVDGRWALFDARQTAEVTSVDGFGRRTRIGFTRQDGSTDFAYPELGETCSVSDAVIIEREITD